MESPCTSWESGGGGGGGGGGVGDRETEDPNREEAKPKTKPKPKPKVVVIMGPTGAGKSKLAIDLAKHFPIEIINADSMQVYRGLDILTNKVPLSDRNGVPHHLLGTVSSDVEFTAKEFRDAAIPIISDIISRNCLPVIVGGTSYYIQALVSPFLLDDTAEDFNDGCLNSCSGDEKIDHMLDGAENIEFTHDFLRDLDPVAANRIHPNNQRRICQYLRLYVRSGLLPSKVYQGKAAENWGRIDDCRYNCCFICVDATVPVLDCYVEHRVDCMIDAGLLGEVYDIYKTDADYTRGLQQAIGVREFRDFLQLYPLESRNCRQTPSTDGPPLMVSSDMEKKVFEDKVREILQSADNSQLKVLLADSIDKVKTNTRRLVRRQKRMLTRLQTLFGWNLNYVDATESISSKLDEAWITQVVGPAVEIIRSFMRVVESPESDSNAQNGVTIVERNLWTQYICQACGNRVLRGDHEWEQHKQGKSHRKRIYRLRKSQAQSLSLDM